ncbi:hypothetical protein CSC17_4157 [Klebsiella oxytoca]|jgi:hypothetical protein|nr:hypothetical protein CSC17_4157 [Klebsiella oxytoca]
MSAVNPSLAMVDWLKLFFLLIPEEHVFFDFVLPGVLIL